MTTRLIVELKTAAPLDRKRINSILASHESDIYPFIHGGEGSTSCFIPGERFGVKYQLEISLKSLKNKSHESLVR